MTIAYHCIQFLNVFHEVYWFCYSVFDLSPRVLLDAENGVDFTLMGCEINKPDLRQNLNDFYGRMHLKQYFSDEAQDFSQAPVFSTKSNWNLPKGYLPLLRSVFESGWTRTLWNYQKGFEVFRMVYGERD